MECQKRVMEKKKEDEQTLAEFNSAHRRQLVQTSYIKRI